MGDDEYFVFLGDRFRKMPLKEIAEIAGLPPELKISFYKNKGLYMKIWSARLTTGVFGSPGCFVGNKGVKGFENVILSMGDKGLEKFTELGFIPCDSCHPENVDGFWEIVSEKVHSKYKLKNLKEFTNKDILMYDAGRISWEEILPITGKVPDRIYLLEGLAKEEVDRFRMRFERLGFKAENVGYFNHNPEFKIGFKEYDF